MYSHSLQYTPCLCRSVRTEQAGSGTGMASSGFRFRAQTDSVGDGTNVPVFRCVLWWQPNFYRNMNFGTNPSGGAIKFFQEGTLRITLKFGDGINNLAFGYTTVRGESSESYFQSRDTKLHCEGSGGTKVSFVQIKTLLWGWRIITLRLIVQYKE